MSAFLTTLAAAFIGCVLAETAMDQWTMWRNRRADEREERAEREEARRMQEVTGQPPILRVRNTFNPIRALYEQHLRDCPNCRARFGAEARN